MTIFDRFFGVREVPQRQAAGQRTDVPPPADGRFWTSTRPSTPTALDTRDQRGGYTGPTVRSGDMTYGESRAPSREDLPSQQGSADGRTPSEAGSIRPGTQSGSSGAVKR